MESTADSTEAATLQVFISRALKKILKEAPKRNAQLRQACVAVIGAFCVRRAVKHRAHVMQAGTAAAAPPDFP